jgi:predicted Zn-dependent peptidase
VKSITVPKLKNFLNTYYSQDMIVTLCSSDPPQEGVALLKKYFHRIPQYKVKPIPSITSDKKRHLYPDMPFEQVHGQLTFTEDSSEQSFISVSFPSYRYSDTKRGFAMTLISEILTGYMNSTLYTVLRQEHGLIYHANSSSESHEDLGIFIVNCTAKNQMESVIRCVQLLLQTIIESSKTMTKTDLDASKEHLVESMRLGKDEPHYIAGRAAQDLYHLGKVEPLSAKIKGINNIQLKDIKAIARDVFKVNQCCISYSGSEDYLKFD